MVSPVPSEYPVISGEAEAAVHEKVAPGTSEISAMAVVSSEHIPEGVIVFVTPGTGLTIN